MTSFLTPEEVEALQDSRLSRRTPFLIHGVSSGQFSLARRYGGIIYKDFNYVYRQTTDELIRDDVIKWIINRRKEAKKQQPKQENANMFEGG